MDNRLIVLYWYVDEPYRWVEREPLSGLRWQVGEAHDAGRKPEVTGTPGQEKYGVQLKRINRTVNRHR
jgi:hypothetical protein